MIICDDDDDDDDDDEIMDKDGWMEVLLISFSTGCRDGLVTRLKLPVTPVYLKATSSILKRRHFANFPTWVGTRTL